MFRKTGFIVIFVWHMRRSKKTREGERARRGREKGRASKHKSNL